MPVQSTSCTGGGNVQWVLASIPTIYIQLSDFSPEGALFTTLIAPWWTRARSMRNVIQSQGIPATIIELIVWPLHIQVQKIELLLGKSPV